MMGGFCNLAEMGVTRDNLFFIWFGLVYSAQTPARALDNIGVLWSNASNVLIAVSFDKAPLHQVLWIIAVKTRGF